MARNFNDSKGRPIVAVTGMGLVTSLGWGKAASWAQLRAGQSGIKRISRFPTEGLRTVIAGTVAHPDGQPRSAPELTLAMASAAADEALLEAGLKDANEFPGPMFVATPPAELEWPQRKTLNEYAGGDGLQGYDRLLSAARTGAFKQMFDKII